jgi:hypothetical protein
MNKNFVIAAILIAFMTVVIYSFPMSQTSKDSSQLAFHSAVCIYKNNELIGPCTHNAMMNIGLNFTRDRLFGTSGGGAGNVNVIVLGNGTQGDAVATATTLSGQINDCGLVPTVSSNTQVVTGSIANASTTVLWTSTCNGVIVNQTALYNQSAPGTSCAITNCTMFAVKNFSSSVTLQSSDQLNVTWYVWAV